MKNKILKVISVLMALCIVLGICAADSESNIPYLMIIIGMVWLILFGYANHDYKF